MNTNDSDAPKLIGKVVSDKRDKTITILIERKIRHHLIGKTIIRTNKIHAHDENNEYQVDDLVTIQETKPISKTKSWRVINLIARK